MPSDTPSSPSDPATGDEAHVSPGELLNPGPIVKAANAAVAAMFDSLATQLPDLIKAQAPPDSPIPAFTNTMIEELQAQVKRALGLPPKGTQDP
jgi:hypothetical protein